MLDELHRRGHEVALRTLAGEVEAMRSRGFAAAPIAAEIEALELDDWRAKTVAGAQMRALGTFCARAPHESRDLLQALEETRPDAAIVDILAWGALSTAEAWNGPWACYCHFPLPLPSPVGPPPGPGLAPAHGPLGRARDVAVRSFSELGFRRFVAPRLRETRRDLGLPPVRNSKEMLSAAPLHLYMSEEPFEYPRPEWPESVVKVGPCAWEPPGEFPSALADVGEPLVLVTTSSDFQDDGRLVKVALAGLAGEPLHVVATSAAANLRDVSIPSNATVLGFAPHSPILARAACAITHGGMGATQKALALGVPVCAVPFGRDQLEVARRVEVASAGTRLPASHLTPRRLRLKVEEAIACKPGAELIAKAFAEAGGAPLAADRIEQRLL